MQTTIQKRKVVVSGLWMPKNMQTQILHPKSLQESQMYEENLPSCDQIQNRQIQIHSPLLLWIWTSLGVEDQEGPIHYCCLQTNSHSLPQMSHPTLCLWQNMQDCVPTSKGRRSMYLFIYLIA